jgi:hypothetical protein
MYVLETSKHFSIYTIRCYQSVVFYTLSTAFNTCNNDAFKRRVWRKCHIELAMGKTDDGYIAARLNICFLALMTVIENAILMRNRLLHSVKVMVGLDGRN